jgi:hypothetical protein
MAITSSSSATSTSHNKALAGVHNLVNRTKKMRFPRRANRYLQQQDDIGYTDGQFMAPTPKSTPRPPAFLFRFCFVPRTANNYKAHTIFPTELLLFLFFTLFALDSFSCLL